MRKTILYAMVFLLNFIVAVWAILASRRAMALVG
jgi:hypothetical protein